MMSDNRKKWLRLGLLFFFIALCIFIGKMYGLDRYVTHKNVQSLIERAGYWGFFVYIALFSLGIFIQLPGMVFVAAGVYAYGQFMGGMLAYVGSIASVVVSFLVVRKIGGDALSELRWSLLQRVLKRLEAHPISTIVILRTLTWLSPPVNYALALSNIRLRDYVVGSAIGLAAPIFFAVLLLEWILSTFVKVS